MMSIFRIYRIGGGGRNWIFDAHRSQKHRNFSKFTKFVPILTSDRNFLTQFHTSNILYFWLDAMHEGKWTRKFF